MFSRVVIIILGLLGQLCVWSAVLSAPKMPTVVYFIFALISTLIVFATAIALESHIDKENGRGNSPRPVEFDESNHDWLKPESMSEDECGSLPAYIDDDQSISCWRVSFWDRLKLLFTGRVWVGVLASGQQPPIWITIKKPFQKPERKIKDKDNGKRQKETLSTR